MLEVKFYVRYGKISDYMSNIGKKPIIIPENTEIDISSNNVTVKGKKIFVFGPCVIKSDLRASLTFFGLFLSN